MTVRDGGRIHGWWNQFHRLIQRTGMAYTRFSDMERSSENNSDLRSQLKCQGVSGGVKGQDERHRTAPWTPATHTHASLCLDNRQRRHTQDDTSCSCSFSKLFPVQVTLVYLVGSV